MCSLGRIPVWGVHSAKILRTRIQALLRSAPEEHNGTGTIEVERLDFRICTHVHIEQGKVRKFFIRSSMLMQCARRDEICRGSSSIIADSKRHPGPFIPSSDNELANVELNLESESEESDSESE